MASSTLSSPSFAVDADHVSKRFARNWALRGVTLRATAGESICLLGPNGSGKTTLLRILATAARPTQGSVRVFGFDSAEKGDEVRQRVGLLSHKTYLYGELTALENLRFAAGMYGLAPGEASLKANLAVVGLEHAADRRVRGFSQGMVQRLALARATLHKPPLLLLDEPYSALDAAALQFLDQFLAQFVASGGTMIVVTHQVSRGLAACRRAVAIREGRLMYDGPSGQFLSSPEAASIGDWD